MDSFYKDLHPVKSFKECFEKSYFLKAPPDWHLIIADIKGSTKAIEEQRYRDVNLLGVATITTICNALKSSDIPYIFGGDGASALVPDQKVEACLKALDLLVTMAEREFSLDLRVGSIKLAKLYEEQCFVEVAKFEVGPQKYIAFFQGKGLEVFEQRLKSDPNYTRKKISTPAKPDLRGLSCRWQPISPKNGKVLSIIIKSREEPPFPLFKELLGQMEGIFERGIDHANPTHPESMEYRHLMENIRRERKLIGSFWQVQGFLRLLEIIYCHFVFRLKWPALIFNRKSYQASMRYYTDFCKMDDSIRFVLDCSKEQKNGLLAILKEFYEQDRIYFGVHESDTALLTCFVQGIEEGGHVHFIDGSQGGYALAARQLKSQMLESSS